MGFRRLGHAEANTCIRLQASQQISKRLQPTRNDKMYQLNYFKQL